MKIIVTKPVEIDVESIRIVVSVRYEEEDIPNNFPLRNGDMWSATIDISTGKIREWPKGAGAKELHMKVCDAGCYYLLDSNGKQVAAQEQEYVPSFMPGDHDGDYIILEIGSDGVIANWRRTATDGQISDSFFPDKE